jgi:hypothetical protein
MRRNRVLGSFSFTQLQTMTKALVLGLSSRRRRNKTLERLSRRCGLEEQGLPWSTPSSRIMSLALFSGGCGSIPALDAQVCGLKTKGKSLMLKVMIHVREIEHRDHDERKRS